MCLRLVLCLLQGQRRLSLIFPSLSKSPWILLSLSVRAARLSQPAKLIVSMTIKANPIHLFLPSAHFSAGNFYFSDAHFWPAPQYPALTDANSFSTVFGMFFKNLFVYLGKSTFMRFL
jgi:hypothetical protein